MHEVQINPSLKILRHLPKMYVISGAISNGSLRSSVAPLQIRLASHSFMHIHLKISKKMNLAFHSFIIPHYFSFLQSRNVQKVNCSIKVTNEAQNLKSPLTYLQHSCMHRLCTFFNYSMLQKV